MTQMTENDEEPINTHEGRIPQFTHEMIDWINTERCQLDSTARSSENDASPARKLINGLIGHTALLAREASLEEPQNTHISLQNELYFARMLATEINTHISWINTERNIGHTTHEPALEMQQNISAWANDERERSNQWLIESWHITEQNPINEANDFIRSNQWGLQWSQNARQQFTQPSHAKETHETQMTEALQNEISAWAKESEASQNSGREETINGSFRQMDNATWQPQINTQ
nr:Tomten [synthetic construct]